MESDMIIRDLSHFAVALVKNPQGCLKPNGHTLIWYIDSLQCTSSVPKSKQIMTHASQWAHFIGSVFAASNKSNKEVK